MRQGYFLLLAFFAATLLGCNAPDRDPKDLGFLVLERTEVPVMLGEKEGTLILQPGSIVHTVYKHREAEPTGPWKLTSR